MKTKTVIKALSVVCIAGNILLFSASASAMGDNSPEQQQLQLSRVQKTLGIVLTPAALSVQGAALKNARMLHYDEYDIAQITYLDARFGPMALCITRSKERDDTAQESEVRQKMNVVYWRQSGYNFMLIGHSPAAVLAEHAASLQAKLA